MAEPDLEAVKLRLQAAVDRDQEPLQLSALHVRGEPISFSEAVSREFEPFEVGGSWGAPWSTTWFHVRGRAPHRWAGQPFVALFDLGFDGPVGFTCEALAWKPDGRPWRGVDPNHRWLPMAGGEIDFYLEAAANPRAVVSGPEEAQSMIALRSSPSPGFTLRQAELRLRDPEMRRTALDFKVLLELALALPEGERRSRLFEALGDFAKDNDPSRLEMALEQPSTSTHRVSAIGHAHIDTAWLWPLRETRRKCARSFSTALAMMDEFPDYRFACSQPAQYAWMKDSYPEIFERIRAQVATGRWEPVGSMWVEADCNLPSGEALVRQLLHGKRFFMRELGYETRDVWLPDVFGYPGSLPQLIAEAGCDYFLTQKLSWNELNKPAHHTFMWEGIDGTRIFTHFPPADTYNGDFSAGQVVQSAANFKDALSSAHSLYLFGWGDGGGGPEPDMIESARRLHNLDGVPRVELANAIDFFDKAASEARDLTTWVGELYFELHRGTYTTQSRTKRLNRLAEQALREAEMWSAAAGEGYPAAQLESAWKQLLVNQFHDILPGSSIDWVYEEAERDLSGVIEVARGITGAAQSSLAGDGDGAVVFNVNAHERREVVEAGGRLVIAAVPPCGWAGVDADQGVVGAVTVSGRVMENGLLRVAWDERGLLTSIWDKEAGREALAAGAPGNLLQLHEDNPRRWDAWDVDIDYLKSAVEVVELSAEEVELSGPLRGAVRFTREFGRSKLRQRMVLDAGSRVLRFETDVDWHEDHKFLKVAFPVAVRSSHATYEIQFGHVEPPYPRQHELGHRALRGAGTSLGRPRRGGIRRRPAQRLQVRLRHPGFGDAAVAAARADAA